MSYIRADIKEIPGGWQHFQTELGIGITEMDRDRAAFELSELRKKNPRFGLKTDLPSCLHDVELFNFQRLQRILPTNHRADYFESAQPAEHVGSTVHVPKASRTCLVQLRRFGDIINILPIAYDLWKRTGVKTPVVVRKEFASILSGTTYCEPIEWSGPMDEPEIAAEHVKSRFDKVVITQVKHPGQEPNYAQESWRLAGYHQRWGTIPLIFDRRDKGREKKLVNEVLEERRNVVLFAGVGTSSPFAHSEIVLNRIKEKFDVVDLSTVIATAPYDLLGLFDRSACLVTCDTMHWHLSSGHTLPVIAFRSDAYGPWYGSPDRHNTVLSIPYKEVQDRLETVVSTIEKILSRVEKPQKPKTMRPKIPVTLIGLNTMPDAMQTVRSLLYSMRIARFDAVVMMTDLNRNPLADVLNRNGIIPFQLPNIVGRQNYEIDQLTKLHHVFQTSHCIFQEADGAVMNPGAWRDEWLEYDYIGAPWADRQDQVGNGGFSLRSHKWCSTLAQIVKSNDPGFAESDYYACVRLRKQTEERGLVIAPYDVAQRFACEDRIYSGEFGAHGSDTIRQNGWNWEQRSVGMK